MRLRSILATTAVGHATLLYPSEFSGAITSSRVQGVDVWMGIDMAASRTDMWNSQECPMSVVCVAGLAVHAGSNETRPASLGGALVGLNMHRLRPSVRSFRYKDVAGVVGLSWRGEFAKGLGLTFRMREERVSLQVKPLEPNDRRGKSVLRLAVNPGESSWSVTGSAEAGGRRLDLGGYAIVFDPTKSGVIAPHYLARELRKVRSLASKVIDSRLFGRCSEMQGPGARAFHIYISVSNGGFFNEKFKVPITWTSGRTTLVKNDKGVQESYCPLSLRFSSERGLVLGDSLLRYFDVSLHAAARLIILVPAEERFVARPATLAPPAIPVYAPRDCKADSNQFICVWVPVDPQYASVQYLLDSVRPSGVSFTAVRPCNVLVEIADHYWYGAPRIVRDEFDGRITMTAKRDGAGEYELLVAENREAFVIDISRARDTVRMTSHVPSHEVHNREKCGKCNKPLYERPASSVDRCHHRFHTSCLDAHLGVAKTCPVCGTNAVRPYNQFDEMDMAR